VIIICPECDTKYRYDERRFDGEVTKKVKCTSCGFTFEARNPTLEPAANEVSTDLSLDFGALSAPRREREREASLADVEISVPPLELEMEPSEPAPAPDPVQAASPAPGFGEVALPSSERYSLAVIAGGQAGTVFQIHKATIVLGRGSAVDVQLRDPEVSRSHARIEIREDEVTLTDLGTTNGTWFDGAKVESVELSHQDEFTLGSTTLMLIVTPGHGIS
jgi:predicted Zn finger-like uncharacterized protein